MVRNVTLIGIKACEEGIEMTPAKDYVMLRGTSTACDNNPMFTNALGNVYDRYFGMAGEMNPIAALILAICFSAFATHTANKRAKQNEERTAIGQQHAADRHRRAGQNANALNNFFSNMVTPGSGSGSASRGPTAGPTAGPPRTPEVVPSRSAAAPPGNPTAGSPPGKEEAEAVARLTNLLGGASPGRGDQAA